MDIILFLLAANVLLSAVNLSKMDKIPESKIDALVHLALMLGALYGFLKLLPEYIGVVR